MRRHELHFSPTLTASSRGDLHNIIRYYKGNVSRQIHRPVELYLFRPKVTAAQLRRLS